MMQESPPPMLTSLKQRLKSLSYEDECDSTSATLVSKLLQDLLRTRQELVQLKQYAGRHASDMVGADDTVQTLKQDQAKQALENSQLHIQLIQEAERFERQERQHYQEKKRLEDKIAELSFWKQSATEKLQASAHESSDLRLKIDELIKINDKLTAGVIDPSAIAAKMVITSPLKQPYTPPPPPRIDQSSSEALQAANARISSLTQQLSAKTRELSSLQQQTSDLSEGMRRREAEITRLGARVAVDPQVAALVARNDSHEAMILQLNFTIDHLRQELKTQSSHLEDSKRLDSALAFEQRARADAEDRLRRAVAENDFIEKEVSRLKADMTTIHSTTHKANALAAAEVDNALSSVTALRQRLLESRSSEERLRAQLESVAEDHERALRESQSLTEEVIALRGALEEMRAGQEESKGMEAAYRDQAARLQEALSVQTSNLAQTQRQLSDASSQLSEAKSDLEVKRIESQVTEGERQQALARLEELQMRLEAIESSATGERLTSDQLSVQVGRLESELRAKASNLSSLEAEAQTLRAQLSEAVRDRGRLQIELGSSEQERARVAREASSLTERVRVDEEEIERAQRIKAQTEIELSRLRAELMAASGDKALLEDKLSSTSSRLADCERMLNNASRDLGGLKSLPTRVDDLQREVDEGRSRLHDVQSDLSRSRAEVRALEGERDRAVLDCRTLSDEVTALRSKLDVVQSMQSQAAVEAGGLEVKLNASQRQLVAKEEDLATLHRSLDQAQRSYEGSGQREAELRAQLREAIDRGRRAEGLVKELEEAMEEARSSKGSLNESLRRLESECQGLRSELEVKRQEVDQLTSLSLRGDATVQEYMSSLKAMSKDLRASEQRIHDLLSTLSSREEELRRLQMDRDDLTRVVKGLDSNRDLMQSEMDHKAEMIASLGHELESLRRQMVETTRMLAMAEGRLTHSDSRVHETDQAATSLKSQVISLNERVRVLTNDLEASRSELRAVHEDLEALVRENQMVGTELAAASGQRDKSLDEARRLAAKSSHLEQLLRAREVELEDMRKAYEVLVMEHRRAESTLGQLERECVGKEGALEASNDEVASLHEAVRSANALNAQYLMDLQSFERQADGLSRQLVKHEQAQDEARRAREGAMEEMRVAQQVRLGLERQREELQRQVAAMDSQIAISSARLEDANNEVASLSQRLTLERNRTAELDGLVAGMRAREYRVDLSATKSESQLSIMQERNRVLEDQVTHLQHQILELQHSRDAQDRELSRLEGEAMALLKAATEREIGQQHHQALSQSQGLQTQGYGDAVRAKLLEERSEAAESKVKLLAMRIAELEKLVSTLEARQSPGLSLAPLRTPAPASFTRSRPPGGGGGGQGDASEEELEDQIRRLQSLLKEEQQRRRQAERDFLDLMESIEQSDLPGGKGDPPQVLASKRIEELQVKMEALEDEKKSLGEQVASTGSLMAAMQAELKLIHSEYGQASSTLDELHTMIDQQKRSIAVSLSPSAASGRPSSSQLRQSAPASRGSPLSHHSTVLSHLTGSAVGGGGGVSVSLASGSRATTPSWSSRR